MNLRKKYNFSNVFFSMCQEAIRREAAEGLPIQFIGYQIPQYEQNGGTVSFTLKSSINLSVSGFYDVLIGYRDISTSG